MSLNIENFLRDAAQAGACVLLTCHGKDREEGAWTLDVSGGPLGDETVHGEGSTLDDCLLAGLVTLVESGPEWEWVNNYP